MAGSIGWDAMNGSWAQVLSFQLLWFGVRLTCTQGSLGFQGGAVMKNQPVNAGDARHSSSVPRLGKGIATHSCILAWEIRTEEPGGLQSLGSQRVRHD